MTCHRRKRNRKLILVRIMDHIHLYSVSLQAASDPLTVHCLYSTDDCMDMMMKRMKIHSGEEGKAFNTAMTCEGWYEHNTKSYNVDVNTTYKTLLTAFPKLYEELSVDPAKLLNQE